MCAFAVGLAAAKGSLERQERKRQMPMPPIWSCCNTFAIQTRLGVRGRVRDLPPRRFVCQGAMWLLHWIAVL
jgi:hypothetical protein